MGGDALFRRFSQVVAGVADDSAGHRDQSESEEESEDYVHSDQNAIGQRDQSAEEKLAARHGGSGCRIGDHIKGEQNERHSSHRQQSRSERSAEDEIANQGLEEEASDPAQGNADSAGEFDVEEAAAHDDDGREYPASPATQVFAEVIWRRNPHPGKEQKREGDAEIGWIQEMPGSMGRGNAQHRLGTYGDGAGENDRH